MRSVCVLVLVLAGWGMTADKPDVAELKKQLKEAEAKVAELKAKLGEAAGEIKVFRDTTLIAPGLMKVGDMGRLTNPNKFGGGVIDIHKVAKILGEDSFVLQPDESDGRLPNVVVKGYPTDGMADGQLLPYDGKIVWKVVGTEKYGAQTLMVLRAEVQPLPKMEPKKVQPKKK